MTWELSDILRVLSTTLVISIHASYHWWFGAHDVSTINLDILINTAINQVGRFTVPIFFILSGFALAKSEQKKGFNLRIFCQRRMGRIIPPYLLFTVLHIIGKSQFQNSDWSERVIQLWQAISTGMGDYHLYFLGIIFQCYIVYPFLRCVSFTSQRLYSLLIISFFLFNWSWLSATLGIFPYANILPDGNNVIYWLPYFQIGIWLAKDDGWTDNLVAKWKSLSWGYLFAIASLIELSEFYAVAIWKNNAEMIGHYTRPTVFVLTLTFLLWAIAWHRKFRQNQTGETLKTSQQRQFSYKPYIKILANASLTTYLTHVWLLRLINPLQTLGGITYVALAISLSWISGILISRMYQQICQLKLFNR